MIVCVDWDPDVVDEAIAYFRANVMFRSFPVEGPADLVLAYLTVYISEVNLNSCKFLSPPAFSSLFLSF
jgi:actin related protein 2/3 complex subunit 3